VRRVELSGERPVTAPGSVNAAVRRLGADAHVVVIELGPGGVVARHPAGLEQLFAVLRRAGLLRSQRGVKGGYAFARPPADITVLEVVELLDGPLGAGAEGVFSDAAAGARAVLANISIAGVVERENREAGASMYYI